MLLWKIFLFLYIEMKIWAFVVLVWCNGFYGLEMGWEIELCLEYRTSLRKKSTLNPVIHSSMSFRLEALSSILCKFVINWVLFLRKSFKLQKTNLEAAGLIFVAWFGYNCTHDINLIIERVFCIACAFVRVLVKFSDVMTNCAWQLECELVSN